ncbi:MAG: PEP-CTERM sorting domain-containing protein [Verrucomicrobiaceae bacterium]|nr:MAG: PEP-CTERM sorting domain-containing protein [Verrucomicrobiaceae bacterium]
MLKNNSLRRHFLSLICCVSIAPLLTSEAAESLTLDFESTNQYSENFRAFLNGQLVTQSSLGAANDYITLKSVAGLNSATTAYDVTPADDLAKSFFTVTQETPLTISANVAFSSATSSFGIYIVDKNNEGAGYLALFNIDQTATTTDMIRFYSGATPLTGGTGTVHSSFDGNAFALNEFGSVSVTYSINANNNPVLSMTAGGFSKSVTFSDITTPFTEVEVAMRISAQGAVGQTVNVDNFLVPVPEPSSAALLGISGVVIAGFRRRRARP